MAFMDLFGLGRRESGSTPKDKQMMKLPEQKVSVIKEQEAGEGSIFLTNAVIRHNDTDPQYKDFEAVESTTNDQGQTEEKVYHIRGFIKNFSDSGNIDEMSKETARVELNYAMTEGQTANLELRRGQFPNTQVEIYYARVIEEPSESNSTMN